MPTMRTDICCFKNKVQVLNYKFSLRLLFLKPNKPNSDIETIIGFDNSTIIISCKEGGEVSFQHNNGQVEQLAEQIEDLRDQSAQQFNDLKELMKKHMEGNLINLFYFRIFVIFFQV